MTEEIDYTNRFETFFQTFKNEEGETPYRDAIERLELEKEISVPINFNDLLTFDPDLANATRTNPNRAIEAASVAVRRIVRVVAPDYADSIETFHARLKDVPDRVSVRKIRSEHIGKLILVDALVTRVSDVKPLLVEGVFQCRQCGEIIYLPQPGQFMAPSLCTNEACRSKGPFELNAERSKFVDWQKIRLQEKPEELPPGALPRALDCILQEDLVDIARPGDPCRVVGILRSTQDLVAARRKKAATFSVFLATNYVAVSEREADRIEITPKEEDQISKMAKDPLIHRKIINSIAPSIYGLTDIKEAVSLLLFGGVPKTLPDGVKIRGDSNILLVGDPGTAKSIHGSETIYVGRTNGRGIQWAREKIGTFVDDLMAKHSEYIISNGDTEILPLHGQNNSYTQAMDPFSLKVGLSQIFEVSRHQTDQLVRIYTRSGRTVLATPNHSFSTIINGYIDVITAQELKPGIYLPVSRCIKLEEDTTHIDLAEEFPETELVNSEIITAQLELVKAGLTSARQAAFTANIMPNTIGDIIHGRSKIPQGSYLRRKRDTSWFPRWLQLDAALGRIIGFYIAEGNVEKTSIRFTNLDESIQSILEKDLIAAFGKASKFNKGVYICQSSLAQWFKRTFKTGAKAKQIPDQIFTAPQTFRCQLLNAYFSGDGTIDKRGAAITTSTVSRTLAYQLSDLLGLQGIFTTIKTRKITKGRYKGRIYYQLRIQGSDVLKYHQHIGFVSPTKHRDLEELVTRLVNRKRYQSRDIIPNFGSLLSDVTKELGIRSPRGSWTRNFLGELRGKTYRQRIGRKYLQKIVSQLHQFTSTTQHTPYFNWLSNLAQSDIYWDKVEKIEYLNQPATVYDIATTDGHFLIANGNLITHNSQILKYVASIAPRGLYTSGKGSTAAGLCVGADSKIVLSSGVESISDVVESHFKEQEAIQFGSGIHFVENDTSDLQVFHSKNLRMELGPIEKFWRIRSPKVLLRIKSKTGKELELTSKTSVLSFDESLGLVWKPASHLRVGDRVATTTTLPIRNLEEKLKSKANSDVFWDELIEITESPSKHPFVYDLTIPRTHNFVVNGFVVHNTAAVLRDPDTEGFTLEAGALVLADRGTACLHPDTRVLINDELQTVEEIYNQTNPFDAISNGEQISIGELDAKVPSLTKDLDIIEGNTTCIRKKLGPGSMLKITTETGFNTIVTANHMLLDGSSLEWKEASEFKKGEYLVAPLRLPGHNNPIHIIDIIPEDWIVCLNQKEKRELRINLLDSFPSLAAVNKFFELRRDVLSGRSQMKVGKLRKILSYLSLFDEWKKKKLAFGRKKSGERLKSSTITPELAYFLGFAYGDGWDRINKRRSSLSIRQSLVNDAQIKRILKCYSDFSRRSIRKYPRTSKSIIRGIPVVSQSLTLTANSNLLARIYYYLIANNLSNLLKLPDSSLAAFLAGIVDSDGCISIKHCTKEYHDYSTVHIDIQCSDNKLENQTLLLALRRFDCYGKIKQGRHVFHIVITARKDVEALIQVVKPFSVKMKSLPPLKREISSLSDKIPILPVARLADQLSKLNTSMLVERGIWSTIYSYKHRRYHPSRGQLRKIQSILETYLSPQQHQEINNLLKRDYFIDPIVSIEEVPYSGPVYDLHVPERHNFCADGLISHNCIDEFDKMRPQDRTAIHESMEQHSFHPSTEILLADGRRVAIGELIDGLFERNREQVVQGIDCEILDTLPFDLEIYTTDFSKVSQIQVDRVSRHRAPDHFYKISFSNGRDIIVTPEHPIFIFEDDSLNVIPAADLRVGSFVPAPRVLPCGHNPGAVLNTAIPRHFNAKEIILPDKFSPKIARLLGYFVSEGYSYFGSSAELGFCNTLDAIIDDIVAHMQDVFQLEGINSVHQNRTYRFVSAQLRDFFKENFPELLVKAKEKRVPPQVFISGELAVQQFLKAAYLGDGSLESESLCYRTSSIKLAHDYQDLLLCLGIQSRINHDSYNDSFKVYIRGSSLPLFFKLIVESWDPRRKRIAKIVSRSVKSNYDHDVFPPAVGAQLRNTFKLLGIPYKGQFHRAIKDNHGITRKLLRKYLQKAKDTLSNAQQLVNSHIKSIKSARQILRWSQETAGRKIGKTRSFIDYSERDGYTPSIRQMTTKELVSKIRKDCRLAEKQLKALETLFDSDIRTLRVKKIEKLENSGKWSCPFVYDVTVEPNHCFISHGLALHNTVSIAKAGIVATLNARTAILAAANPVLGRYVPERAFEENVNLPVTLLSRFDLIFALTDKPEAERDERMADHILALHRAASQVKEPPIDPDLLRKYIAYSRRNVQPRLTDEALKVLKDFYLGMRKAGEMADAPVPITARQLESLVRLTEAHAKMALRETVLPEDAQAAVRIVQVTLQQVGFDRETGQFDIDSIMIGRPKSQRDKLQAILAMLRDLEKELGEPVPIENLVERAKLEGISEAFVRQAIVQLRDKDGLIFEPRPGKLKYIKGA